MIDAIHKSQLLTTSITATTRTASRISMPKVSNSTCRSSHQDKKEKKRSKHQYRGATKARYKTCFKGIVDYKVILVSHFVGADGNKPPPPTTTVTILMTMKASLPPPQAAEMQGLSKGPNAPAMQLLLGSTHPTVRCAKDLFNPIVARRGHRTRISRSRTPWKCPQNPYPYPDRNWQFFPLSNSTVQVDCSKFCEKLDSFIRIEIRRLRPINSDVQQFFAFTSLTDLFSKVQPRRKDCRSTATRSWEKARRKRRFKFLSRLDTSVLEGYSQGRTL